jgi:hypothetical protein
MPTIRYATNACIQYNQVNDLEALGYVMSNLETGKKFLTNAPRYLTLHESQRSALYFLSETNLLASAVFNMYDGAGNLYDTQTASNIFIGAIHNAMPINLAGLDVNGDTTNLHRLECYLQSYGQASESFNFIISRTCLIDPKEIWWLNSLGGMESYLFNSRPLNSMTVNRADRIKYPQENNNIAPSRIYRQGVIDAQQSFEVSIKARTREEAEWLKFELLSSTDVYVRDGSTYLPLLVEAGSASYNYANPDNYVRFSFTYAFNKNVQR